MPDTPARLAGQQIDTQQLLDMKPTYEENGAVSIALGDGIRIRVNPDGVVRVRSTSHQIHVAWLTNKPESGQQSVLGIELTRK